MTELNVAFSIDNNYVNHFIVAAYSLLTHNKNENIHIHILSADITKNSKAAINTLKQLNKNARITYHAISADDFEELVLTMDYITIETYYRLILAELVDDDIKKILYLDADILVKGSIRPIFEKNIDGYFAAGAPDIYLDKDSEHKQLIGTGTNLYINAGVVLFNLEKIRKDNATLKLISAAKIKHHPFQDQDAINVVFAGKILPLEKKFNYQIKDKKTEVIPDEDMVILHYSGSMKPWNRDRVYDAFSTVYDDYKLRSAKYVNSRINNVKYGLLKYSTDNVGDTIQGIAARKFLPKVDYYFERDNMDATKTKPGEDVKVIINGWWGDGPENWPPLDQNLDILPVSMYIEDRIQEEFGKKRSREFLNFFGPIGARSMGTIEFLTSIGVENYFSGCLTLTLNPDKRIKKQDYVLAVDVSDQVFEQMKKQTDRKIIRIGVLRQITTNYDEQCRLAELYLYLYQSAHVVVTTRLHAMLPCLALETPVLFINDIVGHDKVRFDGLARLAHSLSSEDYVAKPNKYDLNKPPKNKSHHLAIRKTLEKTCEQFTGYISHEGFLTKSLEEMIFDADFLQAIIGGASELGDLREENAKIQTVLEHKENHVRELSAELERSHLKYDKLVNSAYWRITKPARILMRLIYKK